MATPGAARFYELFGAGRRAGLTDAAAYAYASLSWWGEHYGIEAPRIVSGRRSAARQRELLARWNRGDRAGLVAKPARSSRHTQGRAWDVRDNGALYVYGAWAPHVGARWGGTFSDYDPVHFDV